MIYKDVDKGWYVVYLETPWGEREILEETLTIQEAQILKTYYQLHYSFPVEIRPVLIKN